MIKKFAAVSLSVILAAGVVAGCATKETTAGGYVPKELKVQFVPSQNAETLEAKAKPLEKLLKDKLGIPVTVSVSTNYNTIVEAMASKQVDVGFLPVTGYVLAKEKKAAEVILQAQRFGVNPKDGSETKDLVDSYRSMIVVKADSPIKTIADLKGKTIAWQDVTSAAGYVWPAVELKKEGIDPEKDLKGITVKGHDKGVLSVLNGDTVAAAVFEDARNTVKKDKPDVFDKVRVLYYTKPIPNDTISVRSDMSAEWVKKLQDAFIAIAKDPEGGKIVFEIYSHRGYAVSSDKNFDIVREYNKAAGGSK